MKRPPEQPHQSVGFLYIGDQSRLFRTPEELQTWYAQFLELQLVITGEPMFVQLEKNVPQTELLERAARRLKKEWRSFDAFIVLLPTEHYVYATALLTYLMGIIGKPVVCMPYHLGVSTPTREEIYAQLKGRIVSAAQVATCDVSGVIDVIGTDLFHPLYTVETTPGSLRGLQPVRHVSYGFMDFGVQLTTFAPRRSDVKPTGPFDCSERVPLLSVDLDTDLSQLITKKNDAYSIEAPHDHVVRRTVERLSLIRPILLITPKRHALYLKGKAYAISLAPAAAAAKMVWLFAQHRGQITKGGLLAALRHPVETEKTIIRL